ncbi:MAG: sigma-70 family RNA polymerase sigma factor [Planctomycetota bacterium]
MDAASLMLRFQRGDEGAYEQLVREHLGFVVRHARRYLHDDSAAEDVAQEVFLRVYRSPHLFREASNFQGWLATIASRLALNELRTRRRKHWRARSTLRDDHADQRSEDSRDWRPGVNESEAPDEQVLREERMELVHEAIGQLPEKQRQALWLQRFEGWDLQQIGETLQLSVPAVKSLLHRARAALLKELQPALGQAAPQATNDEAESLRGKLLGGETA